MPFPHCVGNGGAPVAESDAGNLGAVCPATSFCPSVFYTDSKVIGAGIPGILGTSGGVLETGAAGPEMDVGRPIIYYAVPRTGARSLVTPAGCRWFTHSRGPTSCCQGSLRGPHCGLVSGWPRSQRYQYWVPVRGPLFPKCCRHENCQEALNCSECLRGGQYHKILVALAAPRSQW